MRHAKFTLGGLAAAVGLCALSTSPALAQEYYVRSAEPVGPTVILREDPNYVPPGYVVVPREQVIVREAPERVIVTEPMDGPYADEVYVRDAPPFPPPARRMVRRDAMGQDCRTVEHETRSGVLRVATYCD